ncbi:MAG TPA: tripartite tricarboxylate transporter substrate binding protein [Xanthobacteraceae bacterium]
MRTPSTPRRAIVLAAALVCAASIAGGQARAQAAASAFPERTVRIIVPFPAGGATDIVARAAAERMSAAWKQPVIIENVAGATGAIGAAQAARAPRDGYTLIAGVGTTTAILKALKPNLAFDPINDFAPVSLLTTFPNILVVRGDFPAANVAELIDVLKGNPGKFTYATSGYGSSLHLAAELFKLTTKTDIVHVPYTGSAPAITALLGGHVDLIFDTIPSIWPSVQGGKLKALAVASRQRAPAVPDLPAIAETLPGFDVTSWEGILAPAGTPAPVVGKIADEIKRIAAEPSFAQSLLKLGAVATSNTPEEFAAFIAADYAKWQRVVKEAGIKVQ